MVARIAHLKILLVTARYLPNVGGTEIHTYEVARRLVATGHAFTVLTTDLSGKLPRRQIIGDVQIIRVRAGPPHSNYC